MAIRIAQGAATRVCDLSDRFALQVRGPSDLARAMDALRRARTDIIELGVPWASSVIAAPGGPLVLVEGSDIDYERLRTIPDLVGRRLEEAGVREALVAVPRMGGSLDGLEDMGPAVVLRLFPPAGATAVPPGWVDVAAEWVTTGLQPDEVVHARVLAVEADVRAVDVPALLHDCALSPALGEVVMGDVAKRIRAAAVVVGRDGYPHVAIAAGGPDLDDAGLIARADLLEDLARDLAAEVAYACVDIEPTFRWLPVGPGPGAVEVLSALAGRYVPEAYPFQVLGPGHVAVLGGPPPGSRPLAGGRIELRIDDPAGEGADVLGPVLAGPDDVERLRAEMGDAEMGGVEMGGVEMGEEPAELIVLGPVPSPVVEAFVRWWEWDGEVPEADEAADGRRRWQAVEWLVSTAASAWLDAAGDDTLAKAIVRLGAIDDADQLARAAEILGASITAAAWRLEALPPDDPDEEAVWVVWEGVQEESGCLAAVEAATAGLDDHLVTSTEQRVIECSRDAAVRTDLEATRSTVSDEAWAAARWAMADVIWRRAWDAAGAADLIDDPEHEDADLAAREALAEGQPWEAAAAVARMHERVDDEGWEVAMRVSAQLLAGAPAQVALAAGVAVTREAIGAAARAIARAQPSALRPVVDHLRPAATSLLHEICAVRVA